MSDIKFTLAEDPKAKKIYDRLIKDGVSKSDIDDGYFDLSVIDRGGGQKPELVGRGDGEIAPQEVYEYVLRRHSKYKNLLSEHTGIYHPYALHAPSKRSAAQAKVHDRIRELVRRAEALIEKAGMSRGDARYFDAMYAVLSMALLTSSRPLEPGMRDLLSQADILEGADEIRKMASGIIHGFGECERRPLPLHEHIDKNCAADEYSGLSLFLLAMHEAGFKPAAALCKVRGQANPLISLGSIDPSGRVSMPFLGDVEWAVTSERISLGIIYMLGGMNALGLDVEGAGRWAVKAKRLIPEWASTNRLVGAWHMQRKDHDFPRAYEYYRRAHGIAPGDPSTMFYMATALAGMKRFDEAIPLFRKVVESNVPLEMRGNALGNLGKSLYELGKYDDALEVFKEAIEIDPEEPSYRRIMGDTLWTLGRRGEGLAQIEEAARLRPDDISLRYDAFFMLVEMGRRSDSFAVADEAWNADPENPFSLVMRAFISLHEKRCGEALELIQRAISRGVRNSRELMVEGLAYLFLEDFANAAASFERSLSIDPQSDSIRTFFAVALANNMETERALGEAIKVDPSLLNAEMTSMYRALRAHLAAREGKNDEALNWLKELSKADRENPANMSIEYTLLSARRDERGVKRIVSRMEALAKKDAAFYSILAFHFNEVRQFKKAAAACRRGLGADAEDDFLKWQLAAALLNLKNFGEARRLAAELKISCEDRKIKAYAHLIYAKATMDSGDFEGSIEDFEAAVALAIPEPFPYGVLSDHYLQGGDLAAAEEVLEKALELTRGDVGIYINFGVLSHKRGDHGRAIEFFDRAISMRPDMTELYQARAVSKLLLSDYEGALEDYGRVGKKLWDNGDYASQYSYLLMSKGDSEGALKYARRALKLVPSNDLARLAIFHTLLKRDIAQAEAFLNANRDSFKEREDLAISEAFIAAKREDAKLLLKHAQAAIEANGRSVLGHNFLGVAKHRLGDSVGAKEAFRKALEIMPDYEPARDNLTVMTWREGENVPVGPEVPTGLPDWSDYNFEDNCWTRWLGKDRAFWEIRPMPVMPDFRTEVPQINERMFHAVDSNVMQQEFMRRFSLW
ncbi:MAG: tetratricopeptide repeat protein [Proteobacteria bacterium]|nr:tetratricopeptide repeat protein [Pseudomonadota bacterium]